MSISETEIMEFRPQGSDLFTPESVKKQIKFIQKIMRDVMIEGHHYGTIPGTKKPTLYKAGAEMLCMTFRLAPKYEIKERDLPGGHREYSVVCSLTNIISKEFQGEGVGMCSSMESKYRYRNALRVCPECGADKIMAGRADYGGGWFCSKKTGGCGRKFKDGNPQIETQTAGKIENENPADTFNTILKMAKKRAYNDNVFAVTACSDIFTTEGGDTEDPTPPSKDKLTDSEKKKGGKKKKEEPPKDESEQPTIISEDAAADLTLLARDNDWKEHGFKELIKTFGFERIDEITEDAMPEIIKKIEA